MKKLRTESARHDPSYPARPGGDLILPGAASLTLDNGLTVVALPDAQSTMVTHLVWYKSGAIDDPLGKSGTAHFLEHLMFKGTKRSPAGEFEKRITSVGGRLNAFTSWNSTSYFEQGPLDMLTSCMAFEADRMKNLDLDDDTVNAERSVVLAERGAMIESDASSMLDEALIAACFGSTPYGRPVIGWRHEIELLDRDDAMTYYRRHYTPENAMVIVSGAVAADDVFEAAKEHYGNLPRRTSPIPRVRPRIPPQYAHHRLTIACDRDQPPEMKKHFLVPAPSAHDHALVSALELVAFYLGFGRTCRLNRHLVSEGKIATETDASYLYGAFPERSLFSISVRPASGVSADDLDEALEDILADLLCNGIDDEDLQRCKRRMQAQAIFALDDQLMLTRLCGQQLSVGHSLEELTQLRKRIEAVSAEDVHRALLLIDPEHAVSGVLVPDLDFPLSFDLSSTAPS